MAAYHAKTQFSGSQDGIVFFCGFCACGLQSNKEAGLLCCFFGGRVRRNRCAAALTTRVGVPTSKEAVLERFTCEIVPVLPRPQLASTLHASPQKRNTQYGGPRPARRPSRAPGDTFLGPLLHSCPALAAAQPPDKSSQRRCLDPTARAGRPCKLIAAARRGAGQETATRDALACKVRGWTFSRPLEESRCQRRPRLKIQSLDLFTPAQV